MGDVPEQGAVQRKFMITVRALSPEGRLEGSAGW